MAWLKEDAVARDVLCRRLSPSVLRVVPHADTTTARDIWKLLHTRFDHIDVASQHLLRARLWRLQMKDAHDASRYLILTARPSSYSSMVYPTLELGPCFASCYSVCVVLQLLLVVQPRPQLVLQLQLVLPYPQSYRLAHDTPQQGAVGSEYAHAASSSVLRHTSG